MEEKIREIVRDELSKYFCNIQNNEENNSSIIYDLENELKWKTKECKLLREENSKLKAKIEMYQLLDKDMKKRITTHYDMLAAERGFNF